MTDLTDDLTQISGNIGYGKILFIQINRAMEFMSNGEFARAVAATDGLECLMAYYKDEEYSGDEEEDEMEKLRADKNIDPIDAYSALKDRIEHLVKLAGRRGLLPQGRPETKEI